MCQVSLGGYLPHFHSSFHVTQRHDPLGRGAIAQSSMALTQTFPDLWLRFRLGSEAALAGKPARVLLPST